MIVDEIVKTLSEDQKQRLRKYYVGEAGIGMPYLLPFIRLHILDIRCRFTSLGYRVAKALC